MSVNIQRDGHHNIRIRKRSKERNTDEVRVFQTHFDKEVKQILPQKTQEELKQKLQQVALRMQNQIHGAFLETDHVNENNIDMRQQGNKTFSNYQNMIRNRYQNVKDFTLGPQIRKLKAIQLRKNSMESQKEKFEKKNLKRILKQSTASDVQSENDLEQELIKFGVSPQMIQYDQAQKHLPKNIQIYPSELQLMQSVSKIDYENILKQSFEGSQAHHYQTSADQGQENLETFAFIPSDSIPLNSSQNTQSFHKTPFQFKQSAQNQSYIMQRDNRPQFKNQVYKNSQDNDQKHVQIAKAFGTHLQIPQKVTKDAQVSQNRKQDDFKNSHDEINTAFVYSNIFEQGNQKAHQTFYSQKNSQQYQSDSNGTTTLVMNTQGTTSPQQETQIQQTNPKSANMIHTAQNKEVSQKVQPQLQVSLNDQNNKFQDNEANDFNFKSQNVNQEKDDSILSHKKVANTSNAMPIQLSKLKGIEKDDHQKGLNNASNQNNTSQRSIDSNVTASKPALLQISHASQREHNHEKEFVKQNNIAAAKPITQTYIYKKMNAKKTEKSGFKPKDKQQQVRKVSIVSGGLITARQTSQSPQSSVGSNHQQFQKILYQKDLVILGFDKQVVNANQQNNYSILEQSCNFETNSSCDNPNSHPLTTSNVGQKKIPNYNSRFFFNHQGTTTASAGVSVQQQLQTKSIQRQQKGINEQKITRDNNTASDRIDNQDVPPTVNEKKIKPNIQLQSYRQNSTNSRNLTPFSPSISQNWTLDPKIGQQSHRNWHQNRDRFSQKLDQQLQMQQQLPTDQKLSKLKLANQEQNTVKYVKPQTLQIPKEVQFVESQRLNSAEVPTRFQQKMSFSLQNSGRKVPKQKIYINKQDIGQVDPANQHNLTAENSQNDQKFVQSNPNLDSNTDQLQSPSKNSNDDHYPKDEMKQQSRTNLDNFDRKRLLDVRMPNPKSQGSQRSAGGTQIRLAMSRKEAVRRNWFRQRYFQSNDSRESEKQEDFGQFVQQKDRVIDLRQNQPQLLIPHYRQRTSQPRSNQISRRRNIRNIENNQNIGGPTTANYDIKSLANYNFKQFGVSSAASSVENTFQSACSCGSNSSYDGEIREFVGQQNQSTQNNNDLMSNQGSVDQWLRPDVQGLSVVPFKERPKVMGYLKPKKHKACHTLFNRPIQKKRNQKDLIITQQHGRQTDNNQLLQVSKQISAQRLYNDEENAEEYDLNRDIPQVEVNQQEVQVVGDEGQHIRQQIFLQVRNQREKQTPRHQASRHTIKQRTSGEKLQESAYLAHETPLEMSNQINGLGLSKQKSAENKRKSLGQNNRSHFLNTRKTSTKKAYIVSGENNLKFLVDSPNKQNQSTQKIKVQSQDLLHLDGENSHQKLSSKQIPDLFNNPSLQILKNTSSKMSNSFQNITKPAVEQKLKISKIEFPLDQFDPNTTATYALTSKHNSRTLAHNLNKEFSHRSNRDHLKNNNLNIFVDKISPNKGIQVTPKQQNPHMQSKFVYPTPKTSTSKPSHEKVKPADRKQQYLPPDLDQISTLSVDQEKRALLQKQLNQVTIQNKNHQNCHHSPSSGLLVQSNPNIVQSGSIQQRKIVNKVKHSSKITVNVDIDTINSEEKAVAGDGCQSSQQLSQNESHISSTHQLYCIN